MVRRRGPPARPPFGEEDGPIPHREGDPPDVTSIHAPWPTATAMSEYRVRREMMLDGHALPCETAW